MGLFTNETKSLDRLTGQLDDLAQTTRAQISGLTEAEASLSAAEREFANALADGAIRADDSAARTARERVATRRAELEEQGARLAAVRTRLWALGASTAKEVGDLAAASLAPALAAEVTEALETFTAEWETAATSFAAVMSRKQGIERMLVRPLHLPAPQPSAPADVSSLMPVHAKFERFRAALDGASTIPGPEALEGEEPDLFRAFVTGRRAYENAERARWDKARCESRELLSSR